MNDLDLYINEANKRMTKVFFVCWLSMAALFFVVAIYERQLVGLARWTGKYVPAIGDQFMRGTTTGNFVGTYFGIATLLLPLMVLALIWHQSARKRLQFGMPKIGGGIRAILLIYVIGIPFILFMLFSFYAAPFEISATPPRLAGQHVVSLMLNTSVGLFLFGSILLVVIAVFIGILLAYLWFPFALIIEKIKER